MGVSIRRFRVRRHRVGAGRDPGRDEQVPDTGRDARIDERGESLAVEEPLEIRVGGTPFSVTMRTPGDELDLALGFLVSEGIVRTRDDVASAVVCDGTVDQSSAGNVVDVTLATGTPAPDPGLARRVFTSSSCGICGTASLDAVRRSGPHDLTADPGTIGASSLLALPDRLREGQRVFDRTGGVHAAGLFSAAGMPVVIREDVGRHNAVDKVVGWALREGRLPLVGHVMQVSGRVSFEVVQKAWLAGIPVLAAVSAPSSLAVDLAAEAGMTLVGFSRGDRFTVYAGADRIT